MSLYMIVVYLKIEVENENNGDNKPWKVIYQLLTYMQMCDKSLNKQTLSVGLKL